MTLGLARAFAPIEIAGVGVHAGLDQIDRLVSLFGDGVRRGDCTFVGAGLHIAALGLTRVRKAQSGHGGEQRGAAVRVAAGGTNSHRAE